MSSYSFGWYSDRFSLMALIAVAVLWSSISRIIFLTSSLPVYLGPESLKPGTAFRPMGTTGLAVFFVSVNSNTETTFI